MQDAMELIRRANRSCPKLAKWQELYSLLGVQHGAAAPLPTSEKDWGHNSAMTKRLLLRGHIERAAAEGSLPVVYAFLSGLPENDWEHFG